MDLTQLSDKMMGLIAKELRRPLTPAQLGKLPLEEQFLIRAVRAERWWRESEDGTFGTELPKLLAEDSGKHVTTARDWLSQMREMGLLSVVGNGKGRKYAFTLPDDLFDQVEAAKATPQLERIGRKDGRKQRSKELPEQGTTAAEWRVGVGGEIQIESPDAKPADNPPKQANTGSTPEGGNIGLAEERRTGDLAEIARILGIEPSDLLAVNGRWRIVEGVDVARLNRELFRPFLTEGTWRRRDTQLVALLAGQSEQETDDRTGGDPELNLMLWAEIARRALLRLIEVK